MSANVFGGGGIIIFDTNTGGSGATVQTDNGLSGDGSVGTPVILGGTLNQATTIDGQDFSLEINFENAIEEIESVLTLTTETIELTLVQGPAGSIDQANLILLASVGEVPSFELLTSTQSPAAQQGFFSANSGNNDLASGIEVKDSIDDTGMYYPAGNNYFNSNNPHAGDNYIPQLGDIKGIFSEIVGEINTPTPPGPHTALNTTQTIYAVPAGADRLLRINPALFLGSLGTTTAVNYNLIYTDQGSVVRTINLALVTTLATPVISSQIIYAQGGTNVQLQVILNIAGAQYYMYGSCEFLGIEN